MLYTKDNSEDQNASAVFLFDALKRALNSGDLLIEGSSVHLTHVDTLSGEKKLDINLCCFLNTTNAHVVLDEIVRAFELHNAGVQNVGT